MAYIGTTVTSSSITATVYGLDSSYSYAGRTCAWYLNGTFQRFVSLGANVSSGGAILLSGLSSSTTYTLACTIYGIEGSVTSVVIPSTTATTSASTTPTPDPDPPAVVVSKWSWYASNRSATATQTSTARTAVISNGLLTNFSYLVWNDMVDKVMEIRESKGYSWNSNYATYSNTKMSSGSKLLTATRFNSLRYNADTSYARVYSDDDIYGSYFTDLTDRMNTWIDL